MRRPERRRFGLETRMIGDVFAGVAIAPRVNASDKKQLFSTIAEVGARAFGPKPAEIYAALSEREALGSTGLGHGVAIPHGHIAGLAHVRGIFARLETPVEFAAIDDEPVDLVFALLTPLGRGPEHLQALARVSRLLRRRRLCQQLRAMRTTDGLHALLVRESRPTAA